MAPVIDWQSDESHILLNPALRGATSLRLELLPELAGHIWLATSGTSASGGEIKLVALSKQAFLASAAAVSSHLRIQPMDKWFLALPDFHVGGLSIHARAHLSSNPVTVWPRVNQKWDARQFHNDLSESGSTLVSLVPTQIWDLVNLQAAAPGSLRAAVIGGAALAFSIYRRARSLGWPLLPSYGLTECCSQVATAELATLETMEQPRLRILSHVALRTGADMALLIKSPSLLTGTATVTGGEVLFSDPKTEGWFRTQDMADISRGYLSFLGRRDDCVKINGKNVSQLALQNILEKVLFESGRQEEACVVALEDPRRGNRVVLAMATQDQALLAATMKKFNEEVLPHERIGKAYELPYIPRTDLGKVTRNALLSMLT